ncbi:MAG: galactose mutarotase-like enzyme [Cyclobacteriaceae bacterium]|jgi:galactose mutarotase-like enzyme
MQIKNEFLKAKFQSKGAEITSLIKIKTGQEYIWQANPSHWGRHAPVLFPFVGKLKNDVYTFEGKTYEMGQHGFARDLNFEIERQNEDSIIFLLKSNQETLKNYPFDFELRLEYLLVGQSLITRYHVNNAGSGKMYFSIGGHPAFKCAMTLAGTRSDYHLLFNRDESAAIYLLSDGLFSGKTDHGFNGNSIHISDSLFDRDALVFKNIKSTNVSLVSVDKTWLKFHFQGFPYLGIWSKNNRSPFVCIEPWFGLADHVDHDGDLTTKEGIQNLNTGKTFSCDYKIEIE